VTMSNEAAAETLERMMRYLVGVEERLAYKTAIAALRSPVAAGAGAMREAAAKEPESKRQKRLNAQVNRLYQIANQLSDERECDTRAVDIRMAAAAMKKLIEKRAMKKLIEKRALPAPEVPEADEALIDAWAHSSDPGHDPDAAGTALALRLREVSGRFTAFATDVRRIAAERVELYTEQEMPAAAHAWQEIVTYCEGALKP